MSVTNEIFFEVVHCEAMLLLCCSLLQDIMYYKKTYKYVYIYN